MEKFKPAEGGRWVRTGSHLGFYDRVNLNFQQANFCVYSRLTLLLFSISWDKKISGICHRIQQELGSSTLSLPRFPTLLIHFEKYFPAACVWYNFGGSCGCFSFPAHRPPPFWVIFLGARNVLYVPGFMCIGFPMPPLAIDFYTIHKFFLFRFSCAAVHLIGCSCACISSLSSFFVFFVWRGPHTASDSIIRFNLISHKRMIQMQITQAHMPQKVLGGHSWHRNLSRFLSSSPFFG